MCRSRTQHGFGLISAIALIVLIAVIATAMARLVQENSATDVAGLVRVRTLAAAESGLELALNRAYAPDGAAACTDRGFSFTATGLRGCSAATTCASTTVAGQIYYDLSSRGVCMRGSEASRISRVLVRRRC